MYFMSLFGTSNWQGLILILIPDQSHKYHSLNNCCDQASTYQIKTAIDKILFFIFLKSEC